MSNDLRQRVRSLVFAAKSQVAGASRDSSTSAGRPYEPRSSDGAIFPVVFPGYDLVREMHRGGQGVVYEALQRSTKRRVAIKVMREGPFAGVADRARFEREVEILAQLSHPNIVTIHDRNQVAGHDFFVMDFIDGCPLDRYLDESQVNREVGQVVQLFIKVCEGVNAAHLRGVIHRDLKPSNVLVDSSGDPHILDFGLAKQSGPSDDNTPTMTVEGQFVGSLPWSSPEQSSGVDVDIRTDVYSLGVVLFHALAGRFPYALTGKTADLLDAIRNQPPQRPRTVRRDVDRDLDIIVFKCLAKERERRYQSAGELGRDLRRYLNNEPIDARRDSTFYVLRTTLRRHRLATATALGMILLVAVFGVVTTVQSRRIAKERDHAETQRRRAERAQGFLQSMLASVAPQGVPAGDVTLRSVLDDGADRLEREFGDWPEETASIHETLGQTYDKLGFFTEGETHLRRALDLRRGVLGDDHPLVAQTLGRLALVVFNRQDLVEAEQLLRDAIEQGERVLDSGDAEVLGWQNELGSLLVEQRRFHEAETIVHKSLKRAQQVFADDHRAVFVARWVLARSLNGRGLSREALIVLDQMGDPGATGRGAGFEATSIVRAEVQEKLGNIDEAETILRRIIQARQERLGDQHPALAWNLFCLARLLLEHRADPTAAEPLVRQALDIQAERKGPDHLDTADCLLLLGRVLMERGAYEKAEGLFRENLRIRVLHLEPRDELFDARVYLLQCLESLGKTDQADEIRAGTFP